MVRQRVLVVEDEEPMQRFYAAFFGQAHEAEFIWFLARDGDQAMALLAGELLDLVVLDWLVPGLSGLTVLKALRAHPRTRGLGVLMVTAKSGSGDTVLALESGADDFLAKPFEAGVLLARLRSLVRRRRLTMAENKMYELPGLLWDTHADRLVIEGRRVHLTPKEADILRIFLERPNMIHSHAFLWDAVWGYESEGWEHAVVNVVSSLRMKLGPKWGPRLEARKRKGFILSST